MAQINVGLVGLGGMGRTHLQCYQNNPNAQVVAICDVDEKKLQGDLSGTALNIDTGEASRIDFSGIKTYRSYEDLMNDADVQLVDVCTPTPLHAPVSIAALRAGKDALSEKPMGLDENECREMERAAQESGKQLMIAHCLRYWPHYVKAKELMDSGQYGKVLRASFKRAGGTPWWSWNNWFLDPAQSGGAVLDTHIHDVDTALWWFGEPQSIVADGLIVDGLPLSVDSIWRYDGGPVAHFHCAWDHNGGSFGHGFKIVMERATILHDPQGGVANVLLIQGGREGDRSEEIEVPEESAYQNEINDFVACLAEGRKMERVTPQDGRRAVAVAREELRQIEERSK